MKFFGLAFRKISFLLVLIGLFNVQGFGMGMPHRLYNGKSLVNQLAKKTSTFVQPTPKKDLSENAANLTSYPKVARSLMNIVLDWAIQLFLSQEDVTIHTYPGLKSTPLTDSVYCRAS
ncbi:MULTISPECIES: hypothetical protein [unclassified Siphonobacter]|uniref:hypothetical protein n=1 Tax=unclassified Siphonobacter TaxID=2635712 RepID=UPI000CBDAAFC|nr:MULTISPECIES: hypothetical protein [unclassified Siphonobacter]MDQ1087644.1 hypothetical protein [Siphonobacter sp. SORGH_AS_1065]MDR6193793.1 hypothetical protein [Siphonobacter sp. SORGH_AS_0500]PKK37963.1 hypothetical protein BWI96_02435 [Siphonobacter sp. SORGH_AS_0500]